ncbi:MAG: hypothetical protein V4687_02950 [Bacteroidota bacterium]
MKGILTFGLIITSGIVCCAQNIQTKLSTEKMSDFIKLEKSLKSISYYPDADIILTGDEDQPLNFKRNGRMPGGFFVRYTFRKKDSTITDIQYDYNLGELKEVSTKERFDHQNALYQQQDSLSKVFTSLYGESTHIGDIDPKQIEKTKVIRRQDYWKSADGTKIQMSITLTNEPWVFHGKKIPPTHRLQISISNR